MPVRRTKSDDPIAALGGRENIKVTPSEDGATGPEEAGAIKEIASQLYRIAIGPKWLDAQERIAEDILKSTTLSDPDFLKHDDAPGTIRYEDFSPYPAGSAACYALKILGHIAFLRRMVKAFPGDGQQPFDEAPKDIRENLWLVIDAAMRLASIWTESQINGAFGKPLKTGLKQAEHLEKNRSRANKRRHAEATAVHREWQTAAVEVWCRRPSLSTQACAESVIKRLCVSASNKTVADRIRRLKPSKKVGDAR